MSNLYKKLSRRGRSEKYHTKHSFPSRFFFLGGRVVVSHAFPSSLRTHSLALRTHKHVIFQDKTRYRQGPVAKGAFVLPSARSPPSPFPQSLSSSREKKLVVPKMPNICFLAATAGKNQLFGFFLSRSGGVVWLAQGGEGMQRSGPLCRACSACTLRLSSVCQTNIFRSPPLLSKTNSQRKRSACFQPRF